MNDYYLKASDKQSLVSALKAAGYETSDGKLQYESHQHTIVLRGTLHEATGRTLTDNDGSEYPEMKAIPGYHADLYAESLPVELEQYQQQPATPTFRRA